MNRNPQRYLMKYIRLGYTCEITCTAIRKKKAEVWNIGLRKNPEDDVNDFCAWGRSYRATLAKISANIKKVERGIKIERARKKKLRRRAA